LNWTKWYTDIHIVVAQFGQSRWHQRISCSTITGEGNTLELHVWSKLCFREGIRFAPIRINTQTVGVACKHATWTILNLTSPHTFVLPTTVILHLVPKSTLSSGPWGGRHTK
jgi:hypothetical protein